MINVSDKYKTKIYDDETKTTCIVTYGAYDITAKELVQTSASSTQPFSSSSETINRLTRTERYTTLENNQFLLDGNTDIFKDEVEGWWSVEQSNANGLFEVNPILIYTWQENHTSIGLTFDVGETLFEAIIRWYNSAGNLIDTYNLVNDDIEKRNFVIEHGVTNYQRLEIEFVKVLPYHYAKFQEIAFGVEFKWQDNIVELSVEESLDTKAQEVASNQLTLVLNNIDNAFNKYNPDNRLLYLQEGQQLSVLNVAEIDGKHETVPLGVFYLTAWNNPSEYTSEFVANDLLLKLSNRQYTHSKFYNNATVQTILADLFNDFNLSYNGELQYEIDSNVANVTLTGYIPVVDYRKALQQVCIASGACTYCNRNGKIIVKRLTDGEAVDTIDYTKKAYANDEEAERYDAVAVKQYVMTQGTTTATLFSGEVNGNTTITFGAPATSIAVSGTYTSYTVYANCIDIVGASGTITVTGVRYNIYEKQVVASLKEDMAVGITKQVMEVEGIYLIGKETTAQYVATWLLTELQKYITNEFDWLGNPSIEIGDFVTLQVAENLHKKAIIQKNRFTYTGALLETSEVAL